MSAISAHILRDSAIGSLLEQNNLVGWAKYRPPNSESSQNYHGILPTQNPDDTSHTNFPTQRSNFDKNGGQNAD
jgi:hypothetical protein